MVVDEDMVVDHVYLGKIVSFLYRVCRGFKLQFEVCLWMFIAGGNWINCYRMQHQVFQLP